MTDDPDKEATSALWRKAQDMLAAEFPEAVLVAEWQAIPSRRCARRIFRETSIWIMTGASLARAITR